MASNTIVAAQGLDDIAMVTAMQGSVGLISQQGAKPIPVQSFSRLKQGDLLLMEDSALLKLIYFKNGRQEIWRGNGQVEILESEGRGGGSSVAEINNLSMQVVKQIAKTPSVSKISQNNAKLRGFGVENSIERVEASYKKMRMESVYGDLNPELYLLSALFEMREIEKVEQVLADLRSSRPSDQEARIVIALYQKAIKNLKEGNNK